VSHFLVGGKELFEHKVKKALMIVWLVACLSVTSCSLVQPSPTATVLPPTPTTASPIVTPARPTLPPLPDEAQAANDLEAQIIAVYETVSPAVVNITSRSTVYDFLMRAIPQEGSGSGFVYDRDGHIVTNYHVVENAEELLVTLAGGQVYEAGIVGVDPTNDLAVIRIDAGENLPEPIGLGDSEQLRVGQFVVAIGNPFGLEQTLTTGVISALGRVIQSPEDDRFIGEAIQTDAAINPGNSGGPLLDLQGRVIGVNSQIVSPSQASAGIGFAISSHTVQRVVPELIARGYYPHPWLGTQMLPLTPTLVKVFRELGLNIPVESGLLIMEAIPGGPADRAGVRGGDRLARIGRYQVPVGGDIIIAVDEQPTPTYQALTVYLETQTTVGDTVELTIIRDGEQQTVTVTLDESP
jgi:S1-C subfamily serine protease